MIDEATRLAYLEAMGIQVWVPAPSRCRSSQGPANGEPNGKKLPPPATGDSPAEGNNGLPHGSGAEDESVWDDLRRRVERCTACPLHASRTQTVFGTGDRSAQWMIIGEAPGAQEDLQGEPFVGPAGLLLNEMLRAVGLRREEVFIANILKCRPPHNRDPLPAEVAACSGFLQQQVALVKPKIILAVGRVAAQNLLQVDEPIGRLRGKVHRYAGIPVVVVYHPAYLLRQPREKAKAWQDLQLALRVASGQEGATAA
jgi:uracil-DNA glycosylase family 4